MMKKIKFGSILLLMAISLLLLNACGGDDDDSGNKEEVYVPKDGEWVITDEDMGYDYMGRYAFINGGTELKLLKAGKSVSYIPQYVEYKGREYPVTCIGKYACGSDLQALENIGLYNINIPQSVNTIEEYAFAGCHAHMASIPNSVNNIGDGAFAHCKDLYGVTISEGISVINSYMFWYCDNLRTFSIPKGVKEIKNCAFQGCPKLSSVSIPNSVISIGEQAFYKSGLTSITIPNSVTSIGRIAFWECRELTSIHCKSDIPPTIENDNVRGAFDGNIFSSATLYVPQGTIEAYKSAYEWSKFQNIVEE